MIMDQSKAGFRYKIFLIETLADDVGTKKVCFVEFCYQAFTKYLQLSSWVLLE